MICRYLLIVCVSASFVSQTLGQQLLDEPNLNDLDDQTTIPQIIPNFGDLESAIVPEQPNRVTPPAGSQNLVPASPKDEATINEPTLNILPTPQTQSTLSEERSEVSLTRNNIIAVWLRLAAIGKSQYEIESYLNTTNPDLIMQTREKLRKMAFSSIKSRISVIKNLTSADKVNQIKKMIFSYVSAYGLEADDVLIEKIKKEFGIAL